MEQSVRPKRQTHPPIHLADYELGPIRRRSVTTSTPNLHYPAQHTDTPGEDQEEVEEEHLLNMAARLTPQPSAASSVHENYHDTLEDHGEDLVGFNPARPVDNRPPIQLDQQGNPLARPFIPTELELRQRGMLNSVPTRTYSLPQPQQRAPSAGRLYAPPTQAAVYAPVVSLPPMSTHNEPSAERAMHGGVAPVDRGYNPLLSPIVTTKIITE